MTSSSSVSWTCARPPTLHPLHQLEQCLSTSQGWSENEILQVADFLYGNMLTGSLTLLDASESMITRLNLVKGSSTNEYYLCLTPQPKDVHKIYYCSCRSFLERQKSNPRPGLCKHLLALRLMGPLKAKCAQLTTVTDEEFRKIAMDRVMSKA
jgi:predicted nucleic acid-binding Zn finger protein